MTDSRELPRPLDPLSHPRFGGITTFSRLPYYPDLSGIHIDVAILGIPFDGGTTYRPGARFGPRAVRAASVLCRNYHPEMAVSVYEKLAVVDAGDIAVNPINIQATYKSIEKQYQDNLKKGIRSICIGGDHSVLLPILRSLKKKHGDFVLVQFDAHTDTGSQAWGEDYHHGTPIRRAIEEKILQGSNIFQIGIRGPLTAPDQEVYIKKTGIHVLDVATFHDIQKRNEFFKTILGLSKKLPVYITFDIDGVDPAFAPGTGTPVVGGLTSFEALQSVRQLKGVNLIGADVVEICPAYDHAEVTSLLGAALVFEFLSLMAIGQK
jgi:agmatinase